MDTKISTGWGGAREGSGPKPRKPETHHRNRLMVSFTDEQLAQLTAAAGKQPVPAFIRELVLKVLPRLKPSPRRKA